MITDPLDLIVPIFFKLAEGRNKITEFDLSLKPGVYSYLDKEGSILSIGACSNLERELQFNRSIFPIILPEADSVWIQICADDWLAECARQKIIERTEPECMYAPIFFKIRGRKSGLYKKLSLEGKSGIYVYLNKKNKPIYVGSSTDLAQRLTHHKRYGEKCMPDADSLIILTCENYIERETDLIRTHCPKYNKMCNPRPNASVESITMHAN